MEGSGSIKRLNTLPGSQTRRGKMLGEVVSWGKWAHLLGRSVAFWKADTKRLYVQAKVAAEGELCAPSELGGAVSALIGRMAVVGLVSYAKPWVTRLDVAVDSDCDAADGKLLLDTLEAARLPNGWRTTSSGVPRSTVYFRARTTERVYARAYCRNLKTKTGEALRTDPPRSRGAIRPASVPVGHGGRSRLRCRALEAALCGPVGEDYPDCAGGANNGDRGTRQARGAHLLAR